MRDKNRQKAKRFVLRCCKDWKPEVTADSVKVRTWLKTGNFSQVRADVNGKDLLFIDAGDVTEVYEYGNKNPVTVIMKGDKINENSANTH